MVVCPVCSSRTSGYLRVRGIEIRKCEICTHQFADCKLTDSHTSDQFGDSYFTGGGSGYSDYLADEQLRCEQGRRYSALVSATMAQTDHLATRKMVDVGCAAGFVMKGFAEQGWQVSGVEPNASMASHANVRYGFDVKNCQIEDIDHHPFSLASTKQFDLAVAIQVFAHFKSPALALMAIRSLTRPGGVILIETWNCQSKTARFLGAKWHEYSPPNVLQYFSSRSLDRLAESCGLSFVAQGRPKKQISVAHSISLLKYKYGSSSMGKLAIGALSLLPSTTVLPYPAEDLFWKLYRVPV